MKGFLQGPCPNTGRTVKPLFFLFRKSGKTMPRQKRESGLFAGFRAHRFSGITASVLKKKHSCSGSVKPPIKTRHLGAACLSLLPSSGHAFRSGQPDGFHDFLPFFRFLPDEPGHGRHPVRSLIPQAALPCGRFFHGGIGRNGFLFSGRNRIMSAKKPDCSGFFEATVFLMLSK